MYMEPENKKEEQRDPVLWAIAKRRAGFKRDLVAYFIVNSFLWIIWWLTGNRSGGYGIPWPVWPMLGWGIGLMFQYASAYTHPKENAAEREYDKLKNEKNK